MSAVGKWPRIAEHDAATSGPLLASRQAVARAVLAPHPIV